MSSICTAVPLVGDRPQWQRFVAVSLFLCGLVPGVYEFLHPQGFGFGRGFEMAAIARSLVAHGTFGNPYEPFVTGPTAANPPLYPLFLAALMKLCGQPGFALAAGLLNILLNASMAALLPRFSRVLYGDSLPGVFAGILWVFIMRLMPQWDTTCTMAGLLVFYLLATKEVEQSRSGIGAGVLAGLVSLLNPSTVLISAPWIAYLLISRGVPRARAIRCLTVFLLSVAACNVPWIVRNYRIWHAPVLRTNFGYTLYSSNNDCAQSSLYWNARSGCYARTHPVGSVAEVGLLASLGEIEYDRLRTAAAVQWIRTHPVRFRELTLARIIEFWFPDPGTAPRAAYAVWFVTVLSIPGILLMVGRRNCAAIYIAAAWLLYPLMFYIVVSCDRYRFPLLWTSLLPAGYCAARIFVAIRGPQHSTADSAAL